MDLTKIHDSSFPSNLSKNSFKPLAIPNNCNNLLSSKIPSIVMVPRSTAEITTKQLISMIGKYKKKVSLKQI